MSLEELLEQEDQFELTAIQRQKKDPGRFSLFINEKFAMGISLTTFEAFALQKGQQLSSSEIREIIAFEDFEKARQTALNYVSRKMRSEFEIRQKLQRQDYSASVIEKIVQEFKRKKYLDDRDYAETFTRDFLNFKHAGVYKLRKTLQQRGIAANLIEQTIEKYLSVEEQLDKARRLAQKKMTLIQGKDKKKEKVYRYLSQKGFENSIVMQVINDLF